MKEDNIFYHNNPNLKRTNIPIEFTKEQIEEYIKCQNDPVYFIKKYVKIVHVDYGIIPFELWPFQEKMVHQFVNERFNICKIPRQQGKDLRLTEPIPTPNGWTTMGDLKVGDQVFDMDGNPCNVTYKTEVQYNKNYKITFSDGTDIICGEDHLWYGWDYQQYPEPRNTLRTFSTKQMLETGLKLYNSKYENRYVIPVTKPVNYSKKDLPIDPYFLGIWLGDGTSDNSNLTMHENDLRKLHLLKNKHIPDIYLQSSIEDRLELLRGLMDTDGTSVKGTPCCQITCSYKHNKLYITLKELLSSLGIKFIEYHYVKTEFPSSTLRFSTDNIDNKKFIVSIEPVPTEASACITVDSPTHTYLCSKNYLVTHNTTTCVAVILWFTIFYDNFSVAILANKMAQSQEILHRYQVAYENLPLWLQQGVVKWNNRDIILENGSRAIASATSSSAIRGMSFSLVYLDEFAHVPTHLQNEFYASTYPTITSGTTTKIIITSTPFGLNLFYKIWKDAIEGKNQYNTIDVHWSEAPGRDKAWKEKTLNDIGKDRFKVEFETEFLGSSYTLISGQKLMQLAGSSPIHENENIAVWKEPIPNNFYVCSVDVARGVMGDSSVATIIDCTQIPYEIVARYKSNIVTPINFPTYIYQLCKRYNDAYTIIETNDIGGQIADTLHYDFEYENLFTTKSQGYGYVLSMNSSNKLILGLRTTARSKKIGCLNLKTLIEEDKIILNDNALIEELYTYVEDKDTYNAEEGCHDDIVMTMVLFAWLTQQNNFSDLTSRSIRQKMLQEKEKTISDELTPFGFYYDHGFFNPTVTWDKEIETVSSSYFDRWMRCETDGEKPVNIVGEDGSMDWEFYNMHIL